MYLQLPTWTSSLSYYSRQLPTTAPSVSMTLCPDFCLYYRLVSNFLGSSQDQDCEESISSYHREVLHPSYLGLSYQQEDMWGDSYYP